MIGAILYTSATGFTQRYAHMLAKKTGLPVYDLKGQQLPPAGLGVIYFGWLMAGKIKGLNRARRDWNIQGICAVSMAPNNDPDSIRQANQVGSVPLFYLQGGYAPSKLKGISRPMMWAMTKKITSKPPSTPEESKMQSLFLNGGDFVSDSQLAPVLDWLPSQK